MGIKVEFNPGLALRNFREFEAERRKREECIPERLEAGVEFVFLKEGQRNYWLEGEVPLVETQGNQQLSRPVASVVITEVTHFVDGGRVFTRGKCRVVEVFKDDAVHFDGFARV